MICLRAVHTDTHEDSTFTHKWLFLPLHYWLTIILHLSLGHHIKPRDIMSPTPPVASPGLEIEPGPLLLHLGLPLPLERIVTLAASPTNTLVDPAEF